jgi:hypothetical protein
MDVGVPVLLRRGEHLIPYHSCLGGLWEAMETVDSGMLELLRYAPWTVRQTDCLGPELRAWVC